MQEGWTFPIPSKRSGTQLYRSSTTQAGRSLIRTRHQIHVTMDMITWTETFYLNLIKTGDNSTRVVLGRIGLAQPADWGIAKQHIEQFLLKLESTLQNVNQSVDERN
ncbi:hypothetical protein E6H22_01380 [Candidatus Bathyarchaeota archaeon]|nr:MAG: hypothetical protein E6H22_01380 [Candidatus Bathyarchaeota archaeon]